MSVQIGRISGIPIRLHFTLIITFFLITWTLATSFMPMYLPGLSVIEYWTMGSVGAILLFASILLHELAHSRIAMKYGVKIRQIVLFLFGGVSDISEELTDYRKEAKMAVIGPLTSFAIAGASGLLLLALTATVAKFPMFTMIQGVLYYSALVNAMLGIFNLLPAFPSDGGRILRAILVMTKKNYMQATETAVKIGMFISYGFIAFGLLAMFGGAFVGGMWILLIGWFMISGAQSYLSQMQLSNALASLKLRDIMNTNMITVRSKITVDELIKGYFQVYLKSAFPVVDGVDKRRLLGMVTLKRAQEVPVYNRNSVTADEIMIPVEELAVAGPDSRADIALGMISMSKTGKVFVCDESGSLVGLVSKTDLLGVEMERHSLAQHIRK